MSIVSQLEKQLVELQDRVARRDLALKLEKNREFKKLILEDFCVVECSRYAKESGDPALTTAQRADAMALAQAAGHLQRYLHMVVTMGNVAEHEVKQVQEAIEEARREEV